ncbi:AAA family ATPase, partial [Vibrio anguillarum]
MRLVKARVQNYRSIIDTGEFEVEKLKTILVGPNEAGKTVLLQALQQLNKPNDVNDFDPLRDYPRSKYNDITTGRIDPTEVTVVTGYFELDDVDKKLIPTAYHQCQYKRLKKLNNTVCHALMSAPDVVCYRDIKKSLLRMTSHMDKSYVTEDGSLSPSEALNSLSSDWTDSTKIEGDLVSIIEKWLNDHYQYVEEGNEV